MTQYNSVITDQLQNVIIEQVPESELNSCKPGGVHYLPYHEVIRSDKKATRLRIVCDASSKRGNEVSLNDCLYRGPPLTPLIFDILVRFHMFRTVLIGDLEKAFLNVRVTPEECNYLRYIWLDEINKNKPRLVIYRFVRLLFGLNSSPFVLNATVRKHLSQYAEADKEFILKVLHSLYVDDFVSGTESGEKSFELHLKLKRCFLEGGFNMRKWNSNDPILFQRIESKEHNITNSAPSEIGPGQVVEEDESFSKSLFGPPCTENEIKVMGMIWNKESDALKFDFSKLLASIGFEPVTKRLILRTTAQLYDPLGIISPVTVFLKLIFQDVCKASFDWDEPLPKNIIDRWEEMICDLRNVGTIEIKRHVFRNISKSDIQSLELHSFGNGSSVAFAVAVYLRTELKSGEIDTNLIESKARLAPLKGETVPRLELMSALILSRLIITLSNALRSIVKVDDMYCWQDSEVTLWWIYGITKEFQQFVQNRLVEIRKLVDFRKWRYCPSEENPIDKPIRGVKLSCLIKNSKWWKGPKFLSKTKEFWPIQLAFDKLKNSFEEIRLELKENPRSDF